jgi:LPXTG-motif cell wall-anchored protein
VAGHPVAGESITISSSDTGQKIGAVTDNGDGTYSAVITASTTVGSAVITATDSAGDIPVTATASLASTATALAFTGADDSWMLPAGAGLLLAAGLLLFFVRRRSLHRA